MSTHLHDAIERLAMGELPSAEEQAHLAGCPDCRARLALARRLERLLVEWPVPAPPPDLVARVTAATRRDAWRHEQVVDWGFNIAIAAGGLAMIAGVVALAWLLGSAAGAADASRVIADATGELVARLRGQALVVGTGFLLLTTGLGAWWWAEERWRW